MHEFTAPHMLSSSDAESVAIADLLALEPDAAERLFAQRLGYTESAGAPELRAAASALYETTTPEDVIVVAAAEEGIFAAYHALLQPGDHVVVETPCYESALQVARSAGAEVTEWRRSAGDGWAHDLDALEAALRPDTRLVYINTPAQSDGPPDAARGARSSRRALCRARRLALRRRGLPRARARPGRPSSRGGRPLRPGDLTGLDVEDVRPARPPPRVAGLAGSHALSRRSSISSTTRRSARAPRASSSALSRSGIAACSPIAVAPSCSPTSSWSTRSSPGTPIASPGCGRTRARSASFVSRASRTRRRSVSSSSRTRGCCSFPARCTTSRHMCGSGSGGPRCPRLWGVRSLDRNTFLTQRDPDPQTMRKVSEQPADTP